MIRLLLSISGLKGTGLDTTLIGVNGTGTGTDI